MDRLLLPAEASEKVRRPKSTLAYWRHLGIGPKYAKINGRIVYRESDLDQFIAEAFEAGGDAA